MLHVAIGCIVSAYPQSLVTALKSCKGSGEADSGCTIWLEKCVLVLSTIARVARVLGTYITVISPPKCISCQICV